MSNSFRREDAIFHEAIPAAITFRTARTAEAAMILPSRPGWAEEAPKEDNKSMAKQSAGLLMYRQTSGTLEVFLVHPGGPFWAKKDHGAWTIPKGEYPDDELPLEAARREFLEETGFPAEGPFLDLGAIRQSGGKIVAAWAFAGDCDPAALVSNTCLIEWPPRSRRQIEIPEVDRGAWFSIAAARLSLREAQHPFLDRLCAALGANCS